MSDFACFCILLGTIAGAWEWCVLDAAERRDQEARREVLEASVRLGVNLLRHGRMAD